MEAESEEEYLSCRICLDITNDSVDMKSSFNRANVFSELEERFPNNKFSTALTYWDCFQLCTQINLPSREHILMVLCKDCARKLINSYECMYKAHLSEILLQEFSLKFQQLESNLLNEEEFDKKKADKVEYLCSSCYDSFPTRMHLDDHFSYKICKESEIFRTLKEMDKYNNMSCDSFHNTPRSITPTCITPISTTPILENIKIEMIDEPEKPTRKRKKRVNVSSERNSENTRNSNKVSACRKNKNKTLNADERPTFECDQCGKIYFHERSMTIHKRIHTGDTIPCEVCGKGFVNSKELSVHMRFHNRDYPFVCELCGLKFACMGHLRTHLWKHQGLKFQCEECDKLFGSLKGLNEHRIAHTGIMPFPCSYCDRGYPSKHKYKMHLITVHKVDPTMDEIMRSQQLSKVPKKRLRHTPKLVEVK